MGVIDRDQVELLMSQIVFKVLPERNRWAVLHNDLAVATFATRPEAERAALAIAARHPKRDTAKLDMLGDDGLISEIRIF
jgi:hypothetical protein